MDKCVVFYSWESDLPNSTNRGFIQRALEDAAKSIRNDDSIKIDPVIDRDTSGVPGSPDIANTIFSKIDASDIFACDVSIINQGEKSRPTPNPNVLIELGYALKVLKPERIIMIMDTVFGGPELLPFDLSKKRVSTYRINENDADKSTERKKLTQSLDEAIRIIVSHADKSRAKGKRSGEKAKLKDECEDVLLNGNKLDWRGLVDELWRDIPKRMLEWKTRAEKEWETNKEASRLEAVEICLPSFVPIFVAIKNGKEDLWQESVGSLRQLHLLQDQLLSKTTGGISDVLEVGSQMLYFAGSIGMAIAAETKQLDFINKWMQLPMPGKVYRGEGGKPWAEIYEAHHLWGKYLQDSFKEILKICESDYISGFFPDKELLVKYLFLGNLGQSLFELGQCINDAECRKTLENGNKQSFRANLEVWPIWTLMEPQEFQASTWEIFGSSDRVIKFVFSGESSQSGKFWEWWKKWKTICIGEMGDRPFLFREANWLTLPGEPM